MSPITTQQSQALERRNQGGFTLMEVVVGACVFAVGALALALVVPLGINRITVSGEHSRSSQIATERCENLLTTPYTDTDLDSGTHADASNPLPGNYYVQWVVEDDQPIAKCKRITVTVSKGSLGARALVTDVIVSPESGG